MGGNGIVLSYGAYEECARGVRSSSGAISGSTASPETFSRSPAEERLRHAPEGGAFMIGDMFGCGGARDAPPQVSGDHELRTLGLCR